MSKDGMANSICATEDLAGRALLQNKLASICVDMCKELGAYPKDCTCPDYVDTTDQTPGATTWEELLKHMSDLESWGHESLKGWKKDMAAIQKSKAVFKAVQVSKACVYEDLKHRAAVQNKLAGVCVDMCKEVGAYPKDCTCPNYTDTTDK